MNQSTTETTALATVDVSSGSQMPANLMMNPQLMQQMMMVANAMSEATIAVPVHFRGKPGDCLAVVMQAMQWNMNPFAVAQKTHVVNGQLGYEAQLVHAVLQATGAIEGTFSYEYKGTGNATECRVGAVCRGDKALTWNEWLSAASVTTKNSPLWKTNVPQQMGYLQVKNWARAYKPGAILGVYTDDELRAVEDPAAPTERHMGPVDEVKQDKPAAPAKPGYTPEQFEANMVVWRKVLASKRKTVEEVLATVATVASLTPEQEAAIRALAPTTIDAGTGEIVMTYAEVANKLNRATNIEELAVAGSLIGAVERSQQQELSDLYDRRALELR